MAYWTSVGRLLLVTVLWSTVGLCVRLIEGANPFQINALRCLTMALVIGLWLVLRRGRQALPPLTVEVWRPYLLLALFFGFGTTAMIFGVAHTSIANAASLGATSPVFAAILAPWWLGERTPASAWLAAAAALVGVGLVAGVGAAGTGSPNLGDLAALANAACFACEMMALRRYQDRDMVPGFVLAGLLTALLCGVLGGGILVPLRDAGVILLMGLAHLALPVLLLTRGARDVPAVQITLIALLDIVLSPLWVWLFLGEVPSLHTALGGSLIITAVVTATLAAAHRSARGRLIRIKAPPTAPR